MAKLKAHGHEVSRWVREDEDEESVTRYTWSVRSDRTALRKVDVFWKDGHRPTNVGWNLMLRNTDPQVVEKRLKWAGYRKVSER